MSNFKVLITTSGTGSRLGELTKKTNKALVPINGRATIEYVFDSYPKNTKYVITIGYLADQVREYLNREHPDLNVEFVKIDPFEGPGSSLGYSMLSAENKLQCPFIFHACDTIVIEPVPEPTINWTGGYIPKPLKSEECKQYRTHTIEEGNLLKLNDKGVPGFQSIHIGLTGVKDFKRFWSIMQKLYESNPQNTGWSDVHTLEALLRDGIKFKVIPYSTWLDTGNILALERTEKFLSNRTK
jgi:choline kinase